MTKKRIACFVFASILLLSIIALAEGITVKTYLTMRVTTTTQNAIVDIGDDLLIDIGIEGVTPDNYNWYLNDVQIEGAHDSSYDILGAVPESAGIYRMDGFDTEGNLLVSIDVKVRVNDPTAIPKSGDNSIARPLLVSGIIFSACGLVAVNSKKKVIA